MTHNQPGVISYFSLVPASDVEFADELQGIE